MQRTFLTLWSASAMSFKMHFKWSFAFIWLISNFFRVNIPSLVSPQSDGIGCDWWLASDIASFPWPCRRTWGLLLLPTLPFLSFGGCLCIEFVIFQLSVGVSFTCFALYPVVVLWFNASLMKRTKNGDGEPTGPLFVRFISENVYAIFAYLFEWKINALITSFLINPLIFINPMTFSLTNLFVRCIFHQRREPLE